ncbi:MAG: hypothetical protein RLO52_17605 [Sandaracinaceae bacterium]|nr:MAG: hypothetical protein EVA89_00835 [Sandaracinaceae bacterium]
MSIPVTASGPLGYSVLEALSTLLAPELRDRVLERAFRVSGRREVPETAVEARVFVEGALASAIIEAVGPETARFVLEDLEPILCLAESQQPCRDEHQLATVRPAAGADPYSAPTVRPELMETRRPDSLDREHVTTAAPGPADESEASSGVMRRPDTLPQLVIATAAPAYHELANGLPSGVRLLRVTDAFELFTALDTRVAPVWILVDGYRPTVDLTTLATFLPRVPEACEVMLWGFDHDVVGSFVAKRGWRMLHAEEEWEDLAAELTSAMLFG